MYKLVALSFLMFVLLSFMLCALAWAEEPTDPPVTRPTVGDYEKVLKRFGDWSDNLSNPEYWKGTKLKNKKTGDIVLFENLPDFDKRVFYVISAENLSTKMKEMQGMWEKELEEIKKNPPPKDKEKKPDKQNWTERNKKSAEERRTNKIASQIEVEGFLKNLLELRKKTAVRYEAMMEKLFEDFKDKFSEEERKHNLKVIREWHDKENLILRKKSHE